MSVSIAGLRLKNHLNGIPVNIQPFTIRRFHAVHYWGLFCGILFNTNPGNQESGYKFSLGMGYYISQEFAS